MKQLIPFLNSTVNRNMRKILSEFDNAGYANGYVAVPPEHPWYKKSIEEDALDVHGGITFYGTSDSCCNFNNLETIDDDTNTIPLGWWVFGFDTMHWGDNIENWSKERCIEETLNLKRQLEEVWKKEMDAFHTAFDNLCNEYGVESYILSFGMNGEWYQMIKAPKKDE